LYLNVSELHIHITQRIQVLCFDSHLTWNIEEQDYCFAYMKYQLISILNKLILF